MEEAKKINPDIKECEYGKKELKKITIYPLSVGDQFAVTDIITKIAQELVNAQRGGMTTDYAFMLSVTTVLKENINKVLALVADISEEQASDIIKDLTNIQLVDIVEVIWEVNFESSIKKGKSLLEKGKSIFISRGSLQTSSDSIHNTGSKTSTESPTEKVD